MLDGLARTTLRNCWKMTKSSWFNTAELALSFLQHFLLDWDTSLVEPIEIPWKTKGSVEETEADITITEGFATDGEIVETSSCPTH